MQRAKYVVPEIREAPGWEASPAGDGRVACFLDQSREGEGRKESPESVTGQVPEEVMAEAIPPDEEIWPEPMGSASLSRALAYEHGCSVEEV